jgi:hypothetical protein
MVLGDKIRFLGDKVQLYTKIVLTVVKFVHNLGLRPMAVKG